jgi:hypothetical protein
MSKTAIAFSEFATQKAQAGRYTDVQDVKQHLGDFQYMTWIGTALQEYRQYLTANFPDMTLREAAELTAQEPANV